MFRVCVTVPNREINVFLIEKYLENSKKFRKKVEIVVVCHTPYGGYVQGHVTLPKIETNLYLIEKYPENSGKNQKKNRNSGSISHTIRLLCSGSMSQVQKEKSIHF